VERSPTPQEGWLLKCIKSNAMGLVRLAQTLVVCQFLINVRVIEKTAK
jgi:hypothetical protein